MMTYEEAHAYLENRQREFTAHRWAYLDDLIKANGMAILALEKQIKKKPLIKYPSAACPKMIFKCPVCKCELDDIAPNDYCADCGQAIDWSDEK